MNAKWNLRQPRRIKENAPRRFWQYLLETIWAMTAGAVVSSLGSRINEHVIFICRAQPIAKF